MLMPKIEILVKPGGKTTINGIGFEGPSCSTVLGQIATQLQGQIEQTENHPEFATEPTEHVSEAG